MTLYRCAAFGVLALASTQSAANADVTPTIDLRVRYEDVADDRASHDAQALTARVRAGLGVRFATDWRASVDVEHTTHLGSERFNSTANGETAYPVVADPDNTELDQAWVGWLRNDDRVVAGRQRLVYDNQRFIGNVGWRQNEQTFDAVDVQHAFPASHVRVRYSYLDRVVRVFGDDHPDRALARWDLDAHAASIAWTAGAFVLTGYVHLFDNRTLPSTSHRNAGVRATMKHGDAANGWQLVGEFARQRPYADGAERNDADYRLAEATAFVHGNQLQLGLEVLGGDGSYGFATPFATLHAFNGWADQFLSTPPTGLRDTYVGWRRDAAGWMFQVVRHHYRADSEDTDLGTEWDAAVSRAFPPHWNAQAKIASFDGAASRPDVRKLWLMAEYRY